MGKGAIIPIPNSVILASCALSFLICKIGVALNLMWLQEAAKLKINQQRMSYIQLCALSTLKLFKEALELTISSCYQTDF